MEGEEGEMLTPRERDFLRRNPPDQQNIESDGDDTEKGLNGVGGWLALLVVSLLILSPIANLIYILSSLSEIERLSKMGLINEDDINIAKQAIWGSSIISAALSFYSGWRLVNYRDYISIQIVIICMWLSGPFIMLASSNVFEVKSGDIFRSVIVTLIWTFYLLKSERVKNTYV